MSSYGHIIAKKRMEKGWSQAELAKRIGSSQQQVARFEGGTEIRASVLIALSKAFGCTVSDLLGLDPSSKGIVDIARSKSYQLPIVGRMAAGEAREAIEQRDRTHPVPSELYEGNEDSVWVEIAGNSMNKLFADGTLVLINRRKEVLNGDVAAVFVNGDDVTIKRVYFEPGAIRLHPESYDPEYRDRVIREDDPDAPEVYIFGKAVAYSSPLGWRG